MKVIRANCRIQFTPQDMAFLIATLEAKPGQREALLKLFTDDTARDLLLDSQAVFAAILENPEQLPISLHLFFYVVVRHVLIEADIKDQAVADYVAEILAEFTRNPRDTEPKDELNQTTPSLSEWLESMPASSSRQGFERTAYFANRMLFATGMQEDWLRHRTNRRGAPTVEFYESVGPSLYRQASQHRLAANYDLETIFEQLADRFHDTRLALNELSDRVLHLDDTTFPILSGNNTTKSVGPDSEEPPHSPWD